MVDRSMEDVWFFLSAHRQGNEDVLGSIRYWATQGGRAGAQATLYLMSLEGKKRDNTSR